MTVKFSQPTGMVLQTSGYGTLCITKTGSIDRNISVKVSGGECSLKSLPSVSDVVLPSCIQLFSQDLEVSIGLL